MGTPTPQPGYLGGLAESQVFVQLAQASGSGAGKFGETTRRVCTNWEVAFPAWNLGLPACGRQGAVSSVNLGWALGVHGELVWV